MKLNFQKQTTAPKVDDKYYYSANPFALSGYGLPNCTCYAWGRFATILDENGEGCPKLPLSNAENWYKDCKNYEKGQIPKLGAIAVWKQGKYHTPSDGSGHVAIVEEIYDDGSWLASNSAYKGTLFYLTPHNNKNEKAGYEFEGFIYLPFDIENETNDAENGTNDVENKTNEIIVGTKVLMKSGYLTASSDGSGACTLSYDGNPGDKSNIKYITLISKDSVRPYHMSNSSILGNGDRGWASREQFEVI